MAIFNPDQKKLLQKLSQDLSREELIWTSGYLFGLAEEQTKSGKAEVLLENAGAPENLSLNTPAHELPPPATRKLIDKITILFGTETGNSKKIATQLAAQAKKEKIQVKLTGTDQYKTSDLQNEQYLFIIMSTHGDGEPPEAARKFYEFVHSPALGKLPQLKYAVLALGDKAYPLFCKAGADVDEKLAQAGATRLFDRQDCDVDYSAAAETWVSQLITFLQKGEETAPQSPATATPVRKARSTARITYGGKIQTNINLNDVGSNKATHHIEITAATPVDFEPGDSIGIIPENTKAETDEILKLLGTSGSQFIQFKGVTTTLHQVLKSKLNIRKQSANVLKKYAELEGLAEISGEYELAELLQKYPPVKAKQNLVAFAEILETNAPRLYSIASSAAAHNGEVHITVARNYFEKNNKKRPGLCSDYLARAVQFQALEFYVQPNLLFKLPEDDSIDIIMVGPGTGVAPFRAFVAERDSRGASGRNWLFFGEQHQHTDFLYQAEWQNYLETGVLTRLDVAFSRDSDRKVYVQHKLDENGAEVFAWLEKGAWFYICGAKDPMSKDVEKTLLGIIAREGKMSETAAEQYLQKLKDEDRYLKDVY